MESEVDRCLWARDVIEAIVHQHLEWASLWRDNRGKNLVCKAQNPQTHTSRVQYKWLKDQRQFALGPLFANCGAGLRVRWDGGRNRRCKRVGSIEVHVHASFDSAEVCHRVLEDIGSNACFRRKGGRHQCVGRVVATWQGRTRVIGPRNPGQNAHRCLATKPPCGRHRAVGLAFFQRQTFNLRSFIGGWPCQVGQKRVSSTCDPNRSKASWKASSEPYIKGGRLPGW